MELLKKAQRIFEHVIALNTSSIDQYIEDECGHDEFLLKTVLTLLESHYNLPDTTQVSIESNILSLLATNSNTNDKRPVNRLIQFNSDRYQLIKKINSGGMGSVYLCHRDHDGYKQKVAVKVLEGFENNPDLIERFTQEKHILAQLKHSNITQFIDTGHLVDGTPFVVMEYSPGLTITEYCKTKTLNITQRLKLFLNLCQAVQYAHQNLIIHRDIKPSNVLVTDLGVVKLLDFGIAKFIETKGLFQTQTGHHAMTLAYASPEQIIKKPLGITTDIYSLGVVLYELLTDQRPFDLNKLSPAEYEKLLFTTTAALPSKTAQQNNSMLKGDLDVITLKAIQADRKRRYQTVSELIADINNYLLGKPVLAQKPNFIYRAHKFVKRNTLIVVTVIIICLLTGYFIRQIQAEKLYAEKAQLRAEAISQSFIRAFENADPTQSLGQDIKAEHILNESLNIIKRNTWNDPEIQSELLVTMAKVFYNMGSYENAKESIALIEPHLSLISQQNHTKLELIKAQLLIKQEHYSDGIKILTQIEGSANLTLEKNLILANSIMFKGNLNQAKKIIDLINSRIEPDNPLFFKACLITGEFLNITEQNKEQEIFVNQCLEKASSNNNLWDKSMLSIQMAKSYRSRKQYIESNHFFELALNDRVIELGENHISLMVIYKGLGWNLMKIDQLEESLYYQEKALAIANKYFGENTPKTTNIIYSLANLYDEMGEHEKALEFFHQSTNIMVSNNMQEATKLAFYYKATGVLQNKLELFVEAETSIKNSIKIFAIKQGTYIYRVAEMQVLLSHIYHNQGKDDDARELLAKALPNMYTMHKEGDYFQELGEKLDTLLNGFDSSLDETSDEALDYN